MSGVAIIPARGGSSRIPRKNVCDFHGKPMLHYPIAAAKASGLFDTIYVSTEDDGIAKVAYNCGARIIRRPPRLAQNEIGTQEVMQHAVKALHLKPQTEVCCIYATTPLLLATDLLKAQAFLDTKTAYVVAVADAPDLKDIGWFYYGRAQFFAENMPLWGPYTRHYAVDLGRAIDINVMDDLIAAEAAYEQIHKRAA